MVSLRDPEGGLAQARGRVRTEAETGAMRPLAQERWHRGKSPGGTLPERLQRECPHPTSPSRPVSGFWPPDRWGMRPRRLKAPSLRAPIRAVTGNASWGQELQPAGLGSAGGKGSGRPLPGGTRPCSAQKQTDSPHEPQRLPDHGPQANLRPRGREQRLTPQCRQDNQDPSALVFF